MRFEAQGWEVLTVDGHDMEAVAKAYRYAKETKNGKPTLIVCKTIIGKGIDEIAGTCAAHGEAGVKYADSARESLGLPADSKWFVSPETKEFFAGHKEALKSKYSEWGATFDAWKAANPEKAAELQAAIDGKTPDLMAAMPTYEAGAQIATRNAGADCIQPIGKMMPFYNSGSADLHGSNKNYIKEVGDFSKNNYAGRNFYYGIREHAMGAILNGMGFYGLPTVSGSTFLVFSDYMRASVRVAALSHLPIGYIWTHDSIGVGEDGPTHQPVEQLVSLRAIPGLLVIRPGDANEVVEAYRVIVRQRHRPSVIVLSRQPLPTFDRKRYAAAEGLARGAYVMADAPDGPPEVILIASGSEVSLAVAAHEELTAGGIRCRLVSMPSWELFEEQPEAYRREVLPPEVSARIAIEQGSTLGWERYVGPRGITVGMKTFGASAPLKELQRKFGFEPGRIVTAARDLIGRR